ncbi:MAG TPA: SAM-dependent methyltransferase [Bacteroidales bacterium]|jgi:tRNA U34 5-methylaminomethyl-2-thiouridine-forming methyltransferase MnmC|nr:SAM-dependent methyltransferase [Bacteroidales bacterium]HBZ20369.1 SAM-dependent methyltransferase [Bacteroidales bacterium]
MTEIKRTADGSSTLFVPELNEHYHSVHGAIQESEYIFIICGLNFSKACPVRIFEVGFGTGLNAFLTSVNSALKERKIYYTSIEKYPLQDCLIEQLNYKSFYPNEFGYFFDRIHQAKWNTWQEISDNFTLKKIEGDITQHEIGGEYDLIFFDAFGPEKQPEMWSDEVMRKIAGITVHNGILVTYSVKGEVKRGLRKNGFKVNRLPGPPGKHQIIRAVKF